MARMKVAWTMLVQWWWLDGSDGAGVKREDWERQGSFELREVWMVWGERREWMSVMV